MLICPVRNTKTLLTALLCPLDTVNKEFFQKHNSFVAYVLALTLINGLCFQVQESGQVQGHSSQLQEGTVGPNLFTKINNPSKPPVPVINAALAWWGAPKCLASFSVKTFSCPRILFTAFLAYFSGKLERGFFPSCFPRAQHIWWDILPKEMESIAERWVTLFTGRKRPTSGRESHPPDLTFPGKSRRFTGRKEKYTGEKPWDGLAWPPPFRRRKGGGLSEYLSKRLSPKTADVGLQRNAENEMKNERHSWKTKAKRWEAK